MANKIQLMNERKLSGLKGKWFLDFKNMDADTLIGKRHKNTKVSDHTNRNTVTIVGDGKEYMQLWHYYIRLLINSASNSSPKNQIYNLSWKSDNLNIYGKKSHPSPPRALDLLIKAKKSGVDVYSLVCSTFANDKIFPGLSVNRSTVAKLLRNGVPAALDRRYPLFGSNHQKVTVLKMYRDGEKKLIFASAMLGSVDINIDRWDSNKHEIKKPTHDFGIDIYGPAIADIEWTFLERWNDSSRKGGMHTPIFSKKVPPPIKPKVEKYPNGLYKSVQILHAYGIRTRADRHYFSWAKKEGEFTAWASYLNAVKKASKYIYIEDQYFLASGDPPCHSRPNRLVRETDVIYQLGEAIKRGVRVAVLFPTNRQPPATATIKFQRNRAMKYLYDIAEKPGIKGDFFAASLYNYKTKKQIYVHSKVMIVDDEFAIVGTVNINQRSMTCDSEIAVGVIDAKNDFAKSLRKYLFKEHLRKTIEDPIMAYYYFKKASKTTPSTISNAVEPHRVKFYRPPSKLKKPRGGLLTPFEKKLKVIDPYRGPKKIRKN